MIRSTAVANFLALQSLIVVLVGCADKPVPKEPTPQTTAVESDRLLMARRSLRTRDYDRAATLIHQQLLQQPDNREAIFLAAQIEAARKQHRLAIELARSIPRDDERFGQRAVQLCYEQAVKLKDDVAAERALRELIQLAPLQHQWRRSLIIILNRHGRRHEACKQAIALCRSGQAGKTELLSLLRRTDSFPAHLPEGRDPREVFASGLGLARWWFTAKEYSKALQQIQEELAKAEPARAAALALQGRLLAETQSVEQMSDWYRSCDDAVKEHGDFWAALGFMLIQFNEREGASRALAEAISRNPTDRISFQRLAQMMDASGRPNDAEEFRHHGVAIAKTERLQQDLAAQLSATLRSSLTEHLLALGRPFESLGWAALGEPLHSQRRAALDNQRRALLANTRVRTMTVEVALAGVDVAEFKIDDALSRVFGTQARVNDTALKRPQAAEILATPKLVNVASERGADFQWFREPELGSTQIPIYQSLGGGIGVIDYDLDGWPDLYFAQGSGVPPKQKSTRSDQLLRNIDGTFHQQTDHSSVTDDAYSSGVAVGDVNQDGFPDLVVGNLGDNRLLINNGDGSFADRTDQLGPHPARFTASLAIADINGDDLPDIYESNYIVMDSAFDPLYRNGELQMPTPLSHYAEYDRWFGAVGDGQLKPIEIDESVAKPGTSLGVIITDFDGEAGTEIFIANDGRPNHLLYSKDGNLFDNRAVILGIAVGVSGTAEGCMGIATGDFNRDGTLDLQIANYIHQAANLFLQRPAGGFVDVAPRYGIDSLTTGMVGFGTKALDLDRNGWLDFITSNGHIFDVSVFDVDEPFRMPPQLMMGTGSRYEIADAEELSDYFRGEYLGRAVAMLDFDQDHAIDFVVGHLDKPTALLHNQTTTAGKWVQFELVGTRSERDAIGAVVEVQTSEGHSFRQWVTAGDGYLASDQAVIDIGLGKSSGIRQVNVVWPSGLRQTFSDIRDGHRYLLIENDQQPFIR